MQYVMSGMTQPREAETPPVRRASDRVPVMLQAVDTEAAPFHEAISQARARQSEPAAERDLLSQQHAEAARRYQVAARCMEQW